MGKTVDEQNRLCYPDGLYMKSPDEMHALFSDLPDALERTLEIADKCDVELEFGNTYMPVSYTHLTLPTILLV